MIEYRHIHHRFARREILRDVSIELGQGDVTLLSGKNGSGKSTLLRIMAGLLKPDSGEVVQEGMSTAISRGRKKLLNQVMYLHQHPYLFSGSVQRNLEYAAEPGAKDRGERIARALEWVGLAHMAGEEAKTLSGGERQRVALARALLRRPRILLLDEPTAHLDAAANAQIRDLLREFRLHTDAMLITSHEAGSLDGLASRKYLLENGGIRAITREL